MSNSYNKAHCTDYNTESDNYFKYQKIKII